MNIDITCPQCGTVYTVGSEVVGKRTKCVRCGTGFTILEPATSATSPPAAATSQSPNIPAAAPPAAAPQDIPAFPQVVTEPPPRITPRTAAAPTHFYSHEPATPQFPVLRFIALAYEILAGAVMLIAVVLFVFFLLTAISQPDAILGALLATGLSFFWAILISVSLLAGAQTIRLVLQMEKNTRETQKACRQLADHLCSINTEQ